MKINRLIGWVALAGAIGCGAGHGGEIIPDAAVASTLDAATPAEDLGVGARDFSQVARDLKPLSCDPLDQTTCPASFGCYLAYGGGGECLPMGAVANGNPCDVQQVCGRGSVCAGSLAFGYRCQPICNAYGSEPACPGGLCFALGDAPGIGICFSTCDSLTQSPCAAHEGCYRTNYGDLCLNAGPVTIGGACEHSDSCARGLACLDRGQGAGFRCYQVCGPRAPACPSGICEPALLGFGVCKEGGPPDLSMPDLSMPDLSMPDLSMPDLSLVDLRVVDLRVADAGSNADASCIAGGLFTQIDYPGALYTHVLGINSAGDLVGAYQGVDGNWTVRGFLLHAGVFTTIDAPGATSTMLRSIDDTGKILGDYNDVNAFTWQNGTFTNLSVELATRMNAQGDIVGIDGPKGYLASGGTVTPIVVAGFDITGALGVNAALDVVGYALKTNAQGQILEGHGFLRRQGAFTMIDVPGASRTVANAINDQGAIVGSSWSGAAYRAYLLRDGAFSFIDAPQARATYAYDINSAGVVAGSFSQNQAPYGDSGFVFTPSASCP